MRDHSAAFAAHIQGEVTTLTHIIEIERLDSVTYRYTTHDVDLPFEGNTWSANRGTSQTALEFRISLSVNNLEFGGFLDELGISENDLVARRFDRASIRLRVINWKDLTDAGMKTIRGWFGNVTREGNQFRVEVRSLSQALQQRIGSVISDLCRARLGDTGNGADHGCNYPIDPPTWSPNTTYGTQPVGTGAMLQALANGHGDWDGGVTGVDQNVLLVSGGKGYSNDVEITAYATFNDGTPFIWEAIEVQVLNGVITLVRFPPTEEGAKPGHTEVTFSIIDVGFTNTTVAPVTRNGYHFKLIKPGVSGSTEPSWNLTLEGQTTDGTAIWETVLASYYFANVTSATSRREFGGVFQTPIDFSGQTLTSILGTGASLQALANGAGNWDGGDTSNNLEILSGGVNYQNPTITAYFTNPLTGVPETLVATTVGLDSSGAITYVNFPATIENEKPDSDEVTFVILDQGVVDTGSPAGFFDSGTVVFVDGTNAGIEIDIAEFEDLGSGNFTVVLHAPAPFDIGVGVSDGTLVKFKIGCDLRAQTCKNRFGNFLNFRGEPDIPGTDVLFRINVNE